MSRILVVIDDLSDLVQASPEFLEEQIIRIANVGGVAGGLLLIATETLSLQVMTTGYRVALATRIMMRTACTQLSQSFLDRPGAEELLGQGDLLLRTVV